MEATLDQMLERYPNKKWLVKLLGIHKPDDEIFQDGYRYVKPRSAPIEAQFDNSDNFFKTMAPLTEKEIRNTNRLRLPKGLKLEL